MNCYAQFKNVATITRALLARTIAGTYVNNTVTSIRAQAFTACAKLTTVDVSNVTQLDKEAFYNNISLESLILRSPTVVTLNGRFWADSLQKGTAYIYVPLTLVDSYKTATNWSTYAAQIRAIEHYPEICGGE
jgi:hypothetical protein